MATAPSQYIADVPYFPLGSFSPLRTDVLESVAKRHDVTSMAVAQPWLP
jgi:pyridoxine 4-dehydrogenase